MHTDKYLQLLASDLYMDYGKKSFPDANHPEPPIVLTQQLFGQDGREDSDDNLTGELQRCRVPDFLGFCWP